MAKQETTFDLINSAVDSAMAVDSALAEANADEQHKPDGVLTTYKELREFYSDFLGKNGRSFFLLGRGGTGKSEIYRGLIGAREAEESGNPDAPYDNCPGAYLRATASAVGIYTEFFKYRNQCMVCDDVLNLLKDPAVVANLMAAADTRDAKQMHYKKQNSQLRSEGIPNTFRYTGRVGIVSNDLPRKGAVANSIKALFTRLKFYLFAPTETEVHNYAATWCKDAEILKWIQEWRFMANGLHLRYYHDAMKEKAAGNNWKGELISRWVKADPRLGQLKGLAHSLGVKLTPAALEEQFCEASGLSRATFFRELDRWRTTDLASYSKLLGGKGFYKVAN